MRTSTANTGAEGLPDASAKGYHRRITCSASVSVAGPCAGSWHQAAVLSCWWEVQVEDAIAFLKETGITGAARAAVTSLRGSVREAHKTPPALEVSSEAVISKVSDAWGKLVLQPPGAHAQRAAAQSHLVWRSRQGQHSWGKLVLPGGAAPNRSRATVPVCSRLGCVT